MASACQTTTTATLPTSAMPASALCVSGRLVDEVVSVAYVMSIMVGAGNPFRIGGEAAHVVPRRAQTLRAVLRREYVAGLMTRGGRGVPCSVMSSELQSRLGRAPPHMADAFLVLAVAAAMVVSITVAEEPEATRSPDALAYLLGVSLAALLLLRRARPLGVLIGSIGLMLVYYGLDYPAFALAVPLAAASYATAVAGRGVHAAAILLVVVVVVGIAARLNEGESLADVVRASLITDIVLLGAVLLLGEAVRSRRALAEEVRARLQLAEHDREREAERRVQQELLRIAREMHDVLAHTIAGINVQAAVAADVIDDEPQKARASLQAIRQLSRDGMTELKASVGALREDAADAPRVPAPRIADISGLIAAVEDAGVQVDVALEQMTRPLPPAVELAAYRIVQEALTNVVRHAGASSATVSVRSRADRLELDIQDDGGGSANDTTSGHGVIGMRERAAALGGTFEAGRGSRGGFRVQATLPVGEERE